MGQGWGQEVHPALRGWLRALGGRDPGSRETWEERAQQTAGTGGRGGGHDALVSAMVLQW